MNIYTFKDLVEKGQPYDDLLKSIQAQRLVPILGAGFTVGMSAKKGLVPNADMLKEELINIMAYYEGCSENDKNSLKQKDLSTISDYFVDGYADGALSKKEAHEKFHTYMESFYSAIHNIPSPQQEFLKCGWPYLYTLNYDDAIESVLYSYRVVVPYTKLNTNWLKNHKSIIKLHGDVNEFLGTDDIKYCILSKNQYINSISSQKNKDLRNWLCDDCTSNDLIFIGCSLKNEYDILFAAGNKDLDKLSKDTGKNSYYIYYDTNSKIEIAWSERKALQGYGIDNVIRITPEEFGDFYLTIKDIYAEANKLSHTDKLGKYSNFKFSTLDTQNENNIEYFFDNSNLGIDYKSSDILLPSFFIRRNAGKEIENHLMHEVPICILAGNRFSGKTYVLIDLLRTLQNKGKKIYFMTNITISERMLETISNKKNCLFLFDSGVLTNSQLRDYFYNKIVIMKKNKLQIVYVINRSDRNFIKSFGNIISAEEETEDVKICSVDIQLYDKELIDFNNKIKGLSLVDRKKRETFLDYALRLDETSLKNYNSIMLDTNILSSDNNALLECIIVLAAYPSFSNDIANMLDIRDSLSSLCEKFERTVQKDYLSDLEKNWSTHSGVKFVCNSTYWLYRCLSNFAKTKSNYKVITHAISNIVDKYFEYYTADDGMIDFAVYSQIKPYYYLDTLQKVFFCDAPDKGSLELPEMIYTQLKNVLGNEYQFLHQTAKCQLRLGRKSRENKEKCLELLDMANRIINRAYGLAQQAKGRNMEYTLAHMNLTQALILSNCLRYCDLDYDKIPQVLHEAVHNYYNIYIAKAAYVGDVDNGLDDRDLSDIKWFLECFMDFENDYRNRLVDGDDRKLIQDILSKHYKKTIKIDWKSSHACV